MGSECLVARFQNTLESYPIFLALLCLGGLQYPSASALGGFVFLLGRLLYAFGYYTGQAAFLPCLHGGIRTSLPRAKAYCLQLFIGALSCVMVLSGEPRKRMWGSFGVIGLGICACKPSTAARQFRLHELNSGVPEKRVAERPRWNVMLYVCPFSVHPRPCTEPRNRRSSTASGSTSGHGHS